MTEKEAPTDEHGGDKCPFDNPSIRDERKKPLPSPNRGDQRGHHASHAEQPLDALSRAALKVVVELLRLLVHLAEERRTLEAFTPPLPELETPLSVRDLAETGLVLEAEQVKAEQPERSPARVPFKELVDTREPLRQREERKALEGCEEEDVEVVAHLIAHQMASVEMVHGEGDERAALLALSLDALLPE